MRKFLLFFSLCTLLFSTARAQTPSPSKLAEVGLRLWPEFDRPSMLVIYNLTLSPEIKLPAEIQLRIPATAGIPNAVAARQPDASLLNIPFDQERRGDWSVLSFNATTPEIQVEYYDPGLTKDNSKRHFEYYWPGDFSVDKFGIQVQEPIGATQMQFSPSLGPGQRAGDGMVYYTQDIGALSLGQSVSLVMDYQKESDALSAENVPIDASGPLDTTSSSRQTMISAYLPWLLGFLGLALIVGGGLWYWQSGRKTSEPKKSLIHRRKKSSSAANVAGMGSTHIYCHQCGNRAQPGDLFCRTCGTQLRRG